MRPRLRRRLQSRRLFTGAGASSGRASRSDAALARPLLRRRDGHAHQTAHDDVATSAPLFQAPVGGGTGQRDENSTLFSLSALTAKAAVPPSAPRTTATREDSGLIDLKALAESGSAAAPTANLIVPDHGGLGLFPARRAHRGGACDRVSDRPGVDPRAAGQEVAGLHHRRLGRGARRDRRRVLRREGRRRQNRRRPTPWPPRRRRPRTAAAEPAPTATATASAAASAEAAAEPSATPGPRPTPDAAAARAAAAPRAAGAKGAPAAAEAPAAPKPAGKGNCGCAAGDLMCAMKCSAK